MELFARVCNYDRMNIERLIARAFVLLGGLFWFVAALGAATRYLEDGEAVLNQAWILLGVTVLVFVLSLFFEVLVAVILFVAAVVFIAMAFVVPGIARETGTIALWLLFTAAPALVAAVLFLLAARMQNVCELDVAA